MRPRENNLFIGHNREVEDLRQILGSGRVPHGFLISGIKGIGKATLCYRLTRFILSGGLDSIGNNLFGSPEINLDIGPETATFKKIAGGMHPDLMVLETGGDDEKKEIGVDEVRKISGFLKMTSAESGWRVVIIDSVDEMNRNAANALLKILEEPTAKSILILISHWPGRLLSTIRSRCNLIKMNPLGGQEILQIFAALGEDSETESAQFAIAASEGSSGLALTLAKNEALEIYRDFLAIISALPEPDVSAIIEFSERAGGKNTAEWETANYLIGRFLGVAAKYSVGAGGDFFSDEEKTAAEKILSFSSTVKLLETASRLQEWFASDEIFHLDRRAVLADIFNHLKKAA